VLPRLQAAALRALGRLAALSEPLCCRAVQLAEAGLHASSAEVQQAAVAVLANAIDAYPTGFGDRLLLVGQLMLPAVAVPGAAAHQARHPADSQAAEPDDKSAGAAGAAERAPEQQSQSQQQQQQQQQQVARAAAAAYCRLLLSNKLKLQGVLGPVGAALAGGSPQVAAVVRHALRQMLAAGAAAPRERARLCMDLFHQTPLSCRMQLAEVGTA
jgi:hypothetical protein